jgi:DNA-binding CsgD family transcriptional regulator
VAGIVSSPRFIGRGAELRALDRGLAAAIAGRSAAFLVAGDAGVGKTRLVDEVLTRAGASGATALVGGCLDVEEGRLPFAPFAEALRPHLRELDPGARRELLAPGGEELARLLPELAERPEDPDDLETALVHERLFELVLGLLGRLATTAPLVLVLEDLHWSDRSTRDLVTFLVRNLRAERVLLIGTYRADELYRGHPVRPFLAELGRTRRLERLELAPFSREELAAQLTAIIGGSPDPSIIDSVYERSQGNAFFAEELVASGGGASELPPTLRDILLARIELESPASQDVLHAVAVGGRMVSDQLLAAVSSLAEAERLAALREVLARQLLVRDRRDGYAFRHELLREAVYQELLPGERARLHAAYGVALSEKPELAADPDTVVADLARHWFAAHDLPRALAAAVRAGHWAQTHSGFAEARTHYERALELWDQVPDAETRVGIDRIALLRLAAEVANLGGDHARAAALIRGVLGDVDPAREPALAGVLRERLGRFLWASGDSDAALRAYEEATELVPATPPSAARARVLAARGQGLMLLARHDESAACCIEAIAIARAVGARGEEGHALNTLGCNLAYLGQPEEAVGHLLEARRIAEEVGDLDDLCRAYLNLSDFLAGPLNRLEDAVELALQGTAVAERKGMASDYGVSLQCNAATALLRLGRPDDAAAIVTAAGRRNPNEMAAIDLHQCSARLDAHRGAFDDATAHVAAARKLMVKTVDPPYHVPMHLVEAELALWQGDPSRARETVSAGLSQLESADDAWLAAPLLWLGVRAEADVVAGVLGRGAELERGHATESALALLARARDVAAGDGFVAGATRAYCALCEAEAQRLERSAEPGPWQRAAEAWESLGHPYPASYAHWRRGEALLARRRLREGAEALELAHGIAERIGAQPLVAEIEMLAHRARIELVPAVADDGELDGERADDGSGLTARQREVLALIAAGRTNREIAAALFITEKTAGAHVSSILARLGVRSRVEAATAAHRLGLVPVGED